VRFTRSWVGGEQGSMHNLPVSNPVDIWLSDEPDESLRRVSTAFTRHWFLTSTGVTEDNLCFKGLVALDTETAYRLSGATQPTFPGLWTGFDFAQVLTAERESKKELLAFTRGPVLYRLSESATDDDGISIESQLITRSFDLAPQRDSASAEVYFVKQLRHLDMWFSAVKKTSVVTAYFRPTGHPRWSQLGVPRTIETLPGGYEGYRRRVRFSLDNVSDLVDSSNETLLAFGTEFQFAFVFSGNLTIERCSITADDMGEEPPDPEDVPLELAEPSGIELNDYSYRAE
jgi:hypothetical protein